MIEVLKQMVDVLEYWDVYGGLHQPTEEAIEAGKQAIAELESQEPVEPTEKIYKAWDILVGQHKDLLEENEKLRNQSQRTWVGLTDEEIDALADLHGTVNWAVMSYAPFTRAIEAKLKEKNT